MKTAQQIEVGEDRRAAAPFTTPGEFLSSVAAAQRHIAEDRPYLVDARLRFSAAAGSDEHGNYSDPHGGFLVPASHAPNVLASPSEGDPSAGRTLPLPMLTPTVHVGARVDKDHTSSVSGGLKFYRKPETVTIDTSRMQFERITFRAHELIGLSFGSNELATDSFPTLTTLLEAAFRDERDAVLFEERVRGSGVGESLGVLRSPGLIVVDKEAGQPAATVNAQNVINMRARVWGYPAAVWIANHDAISQITTLAIPIGSGGSHVPAWQPGNANDGTPDMLLGRPLYYNEHASTLGELGDLMCVNWSQYLDGIYRPFEGVSSMHVRFLEHETAFKFWMRGMGAPWWRSPLTPKRSTSTLSPYVALEERT